MPFLVFIIAAILLVWGTLLLFRGSLLAGCAAFLVVGCSLNDYFFKFDAGPITLTLDRLFLAALVGGYVVQRLLGRIEPKPLGTGDWLLVLLLGFLTVSMLTGDEVSAGKEYVPPFWRLLSGYLMPATVYWIARQSALTSRRVWSVLAVLAGFGLYLSVTGLLEAAQMWSLVFPRHIADPKLGLHFGRARGPMLQAVSFGSYVTVCLLSLWLWRRRLGRWMQLLVVATIPLFLAAIYFSYTRTVWLGAALAVFVVLGLTLHRSWRPLVLAVMLCAVLTGAVFKANSFLSFEREYSAADTRDSAYLRACFAYVSWQMFLDSPVVGCGLGRFMEAKLPYLSDRSTSLRLESIRGLVHHNHYLSLLTETGLIGLGLFLAVIIFWARTACQLVRDPESPDWVRSVGILFLGAICVFFFQWMGHELSYSPVDHSLLFLLAGMTVGLRQRALPESDLQSA